METKRTKNAAPSAKPPVVTSPGEQERAALDALLAEDVAATPVAPDMLARITSTAQELVKLEREAQQALEHSEKLSREARRLAETVLPQLMDEAGVPAIELDDDMRVERGEDVYANISAANMKAATVWLEQNGYGAIVKFGFTIPVDKGDTQLAETIRAVLSQYNIPFEEKGGVHASTLTAFVKESLETSRSLPEAITYHVQPRARLKKAKKRAVRRSPV